MKYENNILTLYDYTYNILSRVSFSKSKIFTILYESQKNNIGHIYDICLNIIKNKDYINTIPFDKEDDVSPYFNNTYIPHIDGIMIYTLLSYLNPERYIEIGSGNSTKFAFRSICDHNLKTKIISIDPHPRAEIDKICDKVIRSRLEDMDISFFGNLTKQDLLIIDGSHRIYPNSDVLVFFTEILPNLPKDLIFGIHDISLPNEAFVERLYTEQYMLAAYLLGGADGDTILFPTAYLSTYTNFLSELKDTGLFKDDIKFQHNGGFFWMKKA